MYIFFLKKTQYVLMAIDKDNFGFYNFLAIDVFFTSIIIFFLQ